MRLVSRTLVLLALSGCAEQGATSSTAPTVISAPRFERTAAPGTTQPAVATVEPSITPSAEPVASTSESSAPEAPPAELPNVTVKNIGMHIGGGPNDEKTKEPIRRAVAPHFDALRACYAKEKEPGKHPTFGVDILIPRDGGVAKISSPRSGFGSQATECMVAVFERIEFEKQRQPMRLSYSVRFER